MLIIENGTNETKTEIPYSDEELAEFGDILFQAKLLMMEFSLRSRNNGEEVDLSEYEAHTLLAIRRSPNITSTELAALLGKTKSTLSPLVFKLFSAGYITKEVNPQNRREHLLNITPLGEEVCKTHHRMDAGLMRLSLAQMLKYCTLEEFDAFMKVTRIRNDIFSGLRNDSRKGETVNWGG